MNGKKHLESSSDKPGPVKQKNKYQVLFEEMAQGAFFQSADGTLLEANQAALDMLGLTLEQFVGNDSFDPSWKVFSKDYRKLSPEEHPSMMAIKTGKPVRDKVIGVFNPRTTNISWFSVNAIPQFKSGEKNPFQVFVTLHDITVKIAATEELKKSEERYRELFTNMLNGFALHEIILNERGVPVDYVFLATNKAFEKILGLSSSEILGKRVTEVIPGIQNDKIDWIREYGNIVLEKSERTFESFSETLNKWFTIFAYNTGEGRFATIFTDISDRKQSELELQESKELFSSQFQVANIGLAITNRDQRLLRANNRLCNMLGYDQKELAERNWNDLIHPEDLSKGKILFEQIVSGKLDSYKINKRFVKKDGSLVFTHITVGCVRNSDRTVKFLSKSVEDISESIQAQEKLEKSQYLMSKSQEIGSLGSWELDIVKNILTWTEESYRVFGIPSGKPMDLESFFECVHPEDRDYVGKKWAEALNKQPYDIEHRILANGCVKWVREKADIEFDLDGNPVYAIGFTQDITEVKNVEKQYEALVKNNPSMIMVQETSGEISFVSDQSKSVLGWSPKELLGKVSMKLFHPDDLEVIKLNTRKAFAGEIIENFEYRVISPEGHINWVSHNAIPIFSNGKVVSVQSNVRNINKQKEIEAEKASLQQQLVQSQKMEAMGVLAGGVAHDFNNLLCGILGETELLLEEHNFSESVKADLKSIQKGAERAADLVKQLLLFSRKQKVTMKAISVNDCIFETAKMIRRIIGEQVQVQLAVSEEEYFINGDAANISQVLINLAVNARDAMPEGGKLAISVSKYMLTKDDETLMEQVNPGEYIKVVVEDTGTGIEKDIIDKIFEPFFTSKRLGRGTGLGLSVVLGIIRTHQGAIHVSSEPSKGTSFSIFFPRVEGIQSKKPPVESFTKGNAEKILIIEDETSIQHLLGKILKRYNYQPIFASSMMEAEEVYSRSFRKIELVVCDMVLPDGNGFETIDKLNLIHPIKRLVFASGYLDDISRLDEIKARQIPFLHKPFSTTTFIKTISQALKENLGPQTAGMIQ